MIHTNPAHYCYAQEFIASGRWTVDPDAGLVYGVRGQPFRRMESWGYIQIKFRNPADYRKDCAVLAHRVIWESVHGPIELGLTINHLNGIKTDNRLVNLGAVTPGDNMRHAFATGLNRASRSNAKIDAPAALEIYRRCWAGERDSALAAEYGLLRSAVNNIRNGWNWREVTGHQPNVGG